MSVCLQTLAAICAASQTVLIGAVLSVAMGDENTVVYYADVVAPSLQFIANVSHARHI